jgi:hypothetical protein
MVENGEEVLEKTTDTRAARLARELDQAGGKGKKHNGLQNDSDVSNDETRDGVSTRRHHWKFDSRCPTNRDRLRNWS